MTQKTVVAKIRQMGLNCKVVDGEYQVTVPGRPRSTYYTDDASDALQTARIMHNEQLIESRRKLGIFGA